MDHCGDSINIIRHTLLFVPTLLIFLHICSRGDLSNKTCLATSEKEREAKMCL